MTQSTSGPSHPTGSRLKVICHHCDNSFERRNLKDHTKRMHPGCKPTEKVSGKQTTISFTKQTFKRAHSVNNNEEVKVPCLSLCHFVSCPTF